MCVCAGAGLTHPFMGSRSFSTGMPSHIASAATTAVGMNSKGGVHAGESGMPYLYLLIASKHILGASTYWRACLGARDAERDGVNCPKVPAA